MIKVIHKICNDTNNNHIVPVPSLNTQDYDINVINELLRLLNKKRVIEYNFWYEIILILHDCSRKDLNGKVDWYTIAHEWSK